MHEEIRKFTRPGHLRDDCDLWRIKEVMIKDLEDEMRAEGYAPVLDLNPQWTTEYNVEKKRYDFIISMFGVFVGGEDLSTIIGYSDGKLIRLK